MKTQKNKPKPVHGSAVLPCEDMHGWGGTVRVEYLLTHVVPPLIAAAVPL